MATIRIKRGQSANLPIALEAGEPALALDTGKLYIGTGSSKLLINPDVASNAATATKLQTARTIALSGDVTGSGSFDGSANVTLAGTLASSGVTAGTYAKVTVDIKGRVTAGTTLSAGDIPSLPSSKITGLGTAASVNTGTAAGNVPVLDTAGKLSSALLPAIAINDTFSVASEAAMIALTAQRGDVAIRTDLNRSFILASDDAATLSSWKELLTPVDAVLSVAGRTGAIALSVTDVTGAAPLASPTFTGKVTLPAESPTANYQASPKLYVDESVTALNCYVDEQLLSCAPLASPVLTGTPTAPTAAAGTSTTQIATTAFVVSSVAVIDGGQF